jgi:hypothetical protein
MAAVSRTKGVVKKIEWGRSEVSNLVSNAGDFFLLINCTCNIEVYSCILKRGHTTVQSLKVR